jgi:hypothetical protein
MFEKPEEARMTEEEAARYGREIDAKNALYENVVVEDSVNALSEEEIPPPISEEEIKRRVGEQNYKNIKDASVMNSINS